MQLEDLNGESFRQAFHHPDVADGQQVYFMVLLTPKDSLVLISI